MLRHRNAEQTGFTLVELLVVIAIISILAGLLLPTLRGVMNAGRTIACANNQKQMAVLLSLYSDDNEGYLPNNSDMNNSFGKLKQRWHGHLAPYIYETDNWDSSTLQKNPGSLKLYICPTAWTLYPSYDSGVIRYYDYYMAISNTYAIMDPFVGNGSSNQNFSAKLSQIGNPSGKVLVVDNHNYKSNMDCLAMSQYQNHREMNFIHGTDLKHTLLYKEMSWAEYDGIKGQWLYDLVARDRANCLYVDGHYKLETRKYLHDNKDAMNSIK